MCVPVGVAGFDLVAPAVALYAARVEPLAREPASDLLEHGIKLADPPSPRGRARAPGRRCKCPADAVFKARFGEGDGWDVLPRPPWAGRRAFGITLGLLEISLHLLPGAIPLGFLKKYEAGLRLEIAQRRGLPNQSQVWILERDDGGPELKLFKPFSTIEMRYRDAETVEKMELDANGFCNALPDGGYAAPQIDIVTIGDSFTWCQALGPAATWTTQLSQLLGRPAYNLGRGGVGAYEYLQILKHFGLPKSPEIVVMNIYEGNDLRDAVRYWGHADPERRGGAAALDRRTRAPVDNALGRHSYAYNLLAVAAAKLAKEVAEGLDAIRGREGPREIDFRYRIRLADGEVGFNASNSDTDEVDYAYGVLEGRVDLGVFDRALRDFAELGRQRGFLPVVSYSPAAYTAYRDAVVFEDETLAQPLAAYSDALRAYFARAADEFGFVFVDPTEAMRAAAVDDRREDLLYFPTNLHYTPAGHRLLAEQLARSLAGGRGDS